MGRGGMELYGAQDLGQLGRAEFAGSAGAVAVPGQAYLGHVGEVKRDGVQGFPHSGTRGPGWRNAIWSRALETLNLTSPHD